MKATPICVAFTHITRQKRTGSPASMSSNESGIPTALATLRRAPPSDKSQTVQSIVADRPLKASLAVLKTRRRVDDLGFSFIVAAI